MSDFGEKMSNARLEYFKETFGNQSFHFACLAAYFNVISIEFLYCLLFNFKDECDVYWVIVSDLLMSSLCRPIGPQLYAMENIDREKMIALLSTETKEKLKRFEKEYLAYKNMKEIR